MVFTKHSQLDHRLRANKAEPGKMAALKVWEQMVCSEFIMNGGHKAMAYAAYYPNASKVRPATVNAGANRFFKRPEVNVYLAELALQGLEERDKEQLPPDLHISVKRILKERARLAFFNFTKLFDENGHRIPLANLSPDVAASVLQYDEEETITETANKTVTKRKIKLRFHEKNSSLLALEKIFQLYNDTKAIDEEIVEEENDLPELPAEITDLLDRIHELPEETDGETPSEGNS